MTPLSGSDLQVGERGAESTDSEKEREMVEPAEAAEAAEATEAAERELERLEFSSKEVWQRFVYVDVCEVVLLLGEISQNEKNYECVCVRV